MKHLSNIITACVLVALTACGSTKNVQVNEPTIPTAPQATTSEPPSYNQIIAHRVGQWTTMQCGGSMTIEGPKSLTSAINVRMERDKSIAISLRPLLGIEVGRLVITGDTLLVIDKLHKQYICENVSLLTNGLPANVSTLQDIFLGRPFILGKGSIVDHWNDAITVPNDNEYKLTPYEQQKGFEYEFNFNRNFDILNLCVTPAGAKSTDYKVEYNDVKKTDAGYVAHQLNINTMIKSHALGLAVKYNDINWNQSIKIDTAIPQGYKKVDARNLASMLSGQ